MNLVVVIRQVPDLIEPLQIADSQKALDLDGATFIVNESDDHALEQALLLKEAVGGTVTVLAIDFGDVDNTLYTAAAKGADRIIKLAWEDQSVKPTPAVAAGIYAEAIKALGPDLVLVGVQAHDELEGVLAPWLAARLQLPYVGVIRGVRPGEAGAVVVRKEFPGAVMSRMSVQTPAVLGILGAEQPPRYVPVSRIRAAQKSTQFDEQGVAVPAPPGVATVERLYFPEKGERAVILEGSPEEIAGRIVEILSEKGLLR